MHAADAWRTEWTREALAEREALADMEREALEALALLAVTGFRRADGFRQHRDAHKPCPDKG